MKKILYIDDNFCSSCFLEKLIERQGFKLFRVHSGEEGIELACREIPDLILMDIHMPVMDGWEAIQIIRATESIKHIPIICLTAHFLQGFKEEVFGAGFDDILVKLIIPKELFKKINVLLSNS